MSIFNFFGYAVVYTSAHVYKWCGRKKDVSCTRYSSCVRRRTTLYAVRANESIQRRPGRVTVNSPSEATRYHPHMAMLLHPLLLTSTGSRLTLFSA